MRGALARIKTDGSPVEMLPGLLGFGEFLEFIGLPEIHELDWRFGAAGQRSTTKLTEESQDE